MVAVETQPPVFNTHRPLAVSPQSTDVSVYDNAAKTANPYYHWLCLHSQPMLVVYDYSTEAIRSSALCYVSIANRC
jgi:hypothetical protein